MPITTPRQWRRAFLRALAATANVEMSARMAGVDKTTAYHSRKTSPCFASGWARAMAEGRAALAAGNPLPPDLALPGRPHSVRHSRTGKPCIMATGEGRWNCAIEAAFIAHLDATANVRGAARAVGFSTTAIYARRKTDPAFRKAWDAALEQGYARIEMGLIAKASQLLEPDEAEVIDPPDMSIPDAMNLLKLHRSTVHGRAGA